MVARRFRSLPKVVEAIQFTGNFDECDGVRRWSDRRVRAHHPESK